MSELHWNFYSLKTKELIENQSNTTACMCQLNLCCCFFNPDKTLWPLPSRFVLLRPGGGHPLSGSLPADPAHHEYRARDHGRSDQWVRRPAPPSGPHVAVFSGKCSPSFPHWGDPPSRQDGPCQAALLLQSEHVSLQVPQQILLLPCERCLVLHAPAVANRVPCYDRDMCQKISTHWGSQTWHDFDRTCEYNPVETELINCLADVGEPCQLGCKDLTYCINFNDRSEPASTADRVQLRHPDRVLR